jgi:hypothetical protein
VKPEESTSEEVGADQIVIDEPVQQPAYDWMSPIRAYLDHQPPSNDNVEVERIARAYLDHQPPSNDNVEVERIAHKSRMYYLIDGILYLQGTNGMMMQCISKEEGIQLLEDIHKGVYGSHSSWRSIIRKAFRHRFY